MIINSCKRLLILATLVVSLNPLPEKPDPQVY